MKFGLFLISFSVWAAVAFGAGNTTQSMLDNLDKELVNRNRYFNARMQRIDSLKREAKLIPASDNDRLTSNYHQIFREYSAFQGDSALHYAQLVNDAAHLSGKADNLAIAHTDLIFTNLSAGTFTEAVNIVNHTDLTDVSPEIKAEYYYTCIRLFNDLAAYSNNELSKQYTAKSNAYSDSVMEVAPPGSYFYEYALVNNPKYDNSPQHRRQVYLQLMNRNDVPLETKAMLASVIGDAFRDLGVTDSLIYYKALAAQLDTKAAKHETIATLDLAAILYEQGDLDRSYNYLTLAKEDAEYYNSRNRKLQIMDLLPKVEKARYEKLEEQRRAMQRTAIIITAIVILLIIGITLLVVRLRHTRRQKAESDKHRDELKEKNEALEKTLTPLEESNHIKDEYIGRGFSVHAEYIRKMESLYNMVDRKLMTKQYDELRRQLKRGDIRMEKEGMMAQFDTTVLTLFPDFKQQWDALFPAGESKSGDCAENALTPEMRIFALIRLGMNDVTDISAFLGYSVNTINTYKTKVKNRSHLPNEQFEAAIMEFKGR